MRYHLGEDGIMSHTARRLECCLKIARRYMPDLKRRPGWGLSSVWFRTTALYLEAIRAYADRGNIARLLLTFLALPFSLLAMTGFYFLETPRPRGQYLRNGDEPPQDMTMDRQTKLHLALWLWIIGVFAAYMAQFRDFIGPVLNSLGFE